MKLLRVGPIGSERPAALDGQGQLRDLSGLIPDIMGPQFSTLSAELNAVDLTTLPILEPALRIGPCVANVGKLICIGLNYADHAAEAGMALPTEPIVFLKATSAICGPNDPLQIPRGSEKTDWEVELGVVIGQRAKYVSEEEALDAVFGYCVVNDISERAFQLERSGQWTKGKSHDSFAPIGPWLVTKDEVPAPQDLALELSVNGKTLQHGRTNTMVFGVAQLVSYLSHMMTLQPGDIISTGTPPGVGMGQKPPLYLTAGDVVMASVQGLGCQRQVCCPAE
ncbi:MAG: FAA hydrolase family protein [Gammaproteobacteria bacterium]|nr:FAA hydrolase family protein [Gammaproteobacteria bacterium]